MRADLNAGMSSTNWSNRLPSKTTLVGESAVWKKMLLRRVVEVAHFTDSAVLIRGESGTGKELVARLIHELDPREKKG